ncbi:C40 family peptidase [Streptacidiphilus sp. 4-A2]|nr:C40 family peptidase [Streptacidiphilus sp. 4-A2]
MYSEAADYDVLGSGGTDEQIVQGAQVPAGQAVPGDLLFFGTSTGNTDHVGIYAGVVDGVPQMYDAFDTGTYVREEPVSDANTPTTRCSATGTTTPTWPRLPPELPRLAEKLTFGQLLCRTTAGAPGRQGPGLPQLQWRQQRPPVSRWRRAGRWR